MIFRPRPHAKRRLTAALFRGPPVNTEAVAVEALGGLTMPGIRLPSGTGFGLLGTGADESLEKEGGGDGEGEGVLP